MTVSLRMSRPARLFRYMNPIAMLRHFWRHRDLIIQFTRREIEGRYRGSFLGIFWSLAYPMFMLGIYTFVFGIVLKARWSQSQTGSLGEFALIIFCGLTTFTLFSESVGKAPTLITNVPNYVKKVVFPLEILPISTLGAAFFHMLISFAILLIAQLLLQGSLNWTLVFLPLVLLPEVFLILALMWLLASLGVFVRDIGQAILLILQALFFFTPIFYASEDIPEPFRSLVLLSPIAFVVDEVRSIVLWGKIPNLPLLFGWSLLTAILMMFGYAWFMRTKKAFADVI